MWIHLGKPRITKKMDSIESGIYKLFLKFAPVSEKSSEASGIHFASSNLQVMSSLLAFMYVIGN